jgi:predicted amidophosphoribosyltransferase
MMVLGGIAAAMLTLWVAAPLIWEAAVVVERGVCPDCAVRLEPDSRFCSNCGATVVP